MGIRNRRIKRASLSAVAALAAAVAGQPAVAAPPELAQRQADAISEMPVSELAGLLARDDNVATIDRYLRASGRAPDAVARRAATLIRKLAARRGAIDPETLLRAVDRVSHEAARSLALSPVMRLAIDRDFRPENAALAWDFGPPGGHVMEGFEQVPPDDDRLEGIGVAALRRDDGNPLLTDGIAGLRRIVLLLQDGEYRIILVTRNAGDRRLTEAPFGRQVRVNGIPIIVDRFGPEHWAHAALLTRSGVRAAGGGLRKIGNYLTGNVGNEVEALYARQEGGALVVEGRATDGRLVIEFHDLRQGQSYLTGLIAEPLDRVSDLVLSEELSPLVVPQALRVALEAEILLAAAEAVQGIAPAAGQEFESEEVVTAN